MEHARAFASQLHAVDVIIGLVVATYAVRGYARGLIHEVLSLLALLCAFAFAFRWTPDAVARFGDAIPGKGFSDTAILFLLIFGTAGMAFRIFASAMERMSMPAAASPLNRLGGAAFGAGKGMLVLGCAVLALHAVAPRTTSPDQKSSGNPLVTLTSSISAAPLAAHVTHWTHDLLSTLASAVEAHLATNTLQSTADISD